MAMLTFPNRYNLAFESQALVEFQYQKGPVLFNIVYHPLPQRCKLFHRQVALIFGKVGLSKLKDHTITLIIIQIPLSFHNNIAFINGKQKVEIKSSCWTQKWYGYQYLRTLRVEDEEKKEFDVKEKDLHRKPQLRPLLRKLTDDECAICLENGQKDDGEEMIGYCHWFHTGCINGWLANDKYQCPVCRQSWLHDM